VVRGLDATITLREPFFMSTQYRVTPANPAVVGGAPQRSGIGAALSQVTERVHDSRLGASGTGRKLFANAKGLARAGMGELGYSTAPMIGTGYAHQLEAVQRAISAGLTEEPTMSLDDTIIVMKVLDRARASWNTQR
jgi:hypothetical protein